jgi:hypothetical protein
VYEVKHDLNLEVEDRDRWLEEEGHKNKKLKQERDKLEDINNKQESEIMELKLENWRLHQQLAGKKGDEGKD